MILQQASAARDPEAAAIDRRRQLAMLLQRQGMQSDFRTPASVWASALNSVAGAGVNFLADREQTNLDTRRGEESRAFLGRLSGLLGGGGGEAAPAAPGAVQQQALPPLPRGGGGAPSPDVLAAVQEASQETGIPAQVLLAQIRQESNFNPTARGRAGEIGLGQIMPATARQPGFGVQPVDPASLDDPRTNVRFQAQYLGGRGRAAGVTDWNDPAQVDRALAAYNGGGDPNYVQNVRRHLPEVQAYLGGGGAPQAGVAQPPTPQVQGQTPRGAPMWALAFEALQSRNPQIQQYAPMLGQIAAQRPERPQSEEVVRVRQPDGSERLVPRSQAAGMVSAPERSEAERVWLPRWRELSALGENATPQQAQERDILARRIGGAGVTVNNNNQPENVLAREVSQRGAARIDTMLPQAQQAGEAVRTAQRAQTLLDSGVITGTGAGAREAIERAFATAGLVDGQRVANTGQLMSELASATLAAAGGLSGPTSDRDILFLREVAGGNVALTADTIRRIVQVSADRANRTLGEYNRVAESLQRDQNVPQTARDLYRPIPVPTVDAAAAPAGQQQPQQQGQVPAPRSMEEMQALPPGTVYRAPDGSLRRRGQ